MVPLLEAAAAAWALSRAEDDARAATGLADLLRGSRLIVPATEAAVLALWVGAPPASTRDRS